MPNLTKILIYVFSIVLVIGLVIIIRKESSMKDSQVFKSISTPKLYQELQTREDLQVATFAGGCFWCMEGPFEAEAGVEAAIAGYAGGDEVDPTYELVSSGRSNHKEAVQVFYDPDQVSYERLVDIYWLQVDPTDPDGQFADRGKHYATAIYYHSDNQQQEAEKSKKKLDESDRYDKPVVTEISPFKNFYLAEENHQDYYKKSSQRYELYKKGSGRADHIEENKEFKALETSTKP